MTPTKEQIIKAASHCVDVGICSPCSLYSEACFTIFARALLESRAEVEELQKIHPTVDQRLMVFINRLVENDTEDTMMRQARKRYYFAVLDIVNEQLAALKAKEERDAILH